MREERVLVVVRLFSPARWRAILCLVGHVRRLNPRLARLVRVLLTLLVIAVVSWHVDGPALVRTFASLGAVEVSALLALVCVQQVLLSQRFATVLRGLSPGSHLRLRDLVIDQQVGTAYNVVLPSAVGGDAVRALRAQRRLSAANDRVAEAWGAVLLDRLLGLLA
ncbi:MAG TPA: lysylphosphatidylglycerol synthase domain-containing protein, partial [Polyangiales bacterium]|nr:lysylphosphatidylglycerol synthase domain-containing protein [Polyangiales bacterium]